LLEQIGFWQLMAISGGRVISRETGITLPVSRGYMVDIDLDVTDTYCVKRIFRRAGKTTIKGQVSNVYCDQIGQIAYLASCWVNVPFGEDLK